MYKGILKSLLRQEVIGIILVVVLISAILSVTAPGFNSFFNLNSLSRTVSITIIVGLSQLFVLSIGQFNLALGSMGLLSGLFTAVLLQDYQVPVLLAIIIGLIIGAAAGGIQGWIITKTGINPFIVTLVLVSIYSGIATAISRGSVYTQQPDIFRAIGSTNLALWIPALLLISIIVALILYVVFNRTAFGRQVLATGENEKAAAFAGISTMYIIILAHTFSGLLAGTAGILEVARLGSATLTIGSDWLLISFAAPILGGTLLSGGKVSVVGTIFGAILMSIIVNGLFMLDVSHYWFQTFLGIILLGSYAVDKLRRNYMLGREAL